MLSCKRSGVARMMAVLCLVCLLFAAVPAEVSAVEVGQIILVPFNFAPQGWLYCEGQLLPIQSFPYLFTLIGTRYGGDGATTFALPDLRGAEPKPGVRYIIALFGVFPN